MSATASDVTVVIVAYNSEAVIRACLLSVEEVGKVIVVDNASSDRTIAVCNSVLPKAEIIANSTNVGFGRACNLGLRRTVTRYVLFLNPDAAMRPGAISSLLLAGEEFSGAAMFGPTLENAQGRAVVSHDASRLRRHSHPRGEPVFPSGPCCVEFLLGAVLFARTEVLEAIGGFDESVFLFYEDDDLCTRVRKAGYSIIFLPSASALHLWGRSSAGADELSATKAWHMAWSRLYMLEKHLGKRAMRWEALARILYYGLRTLAFSASANRKRAGVSMAQFRGVLAYLAGKSCFKEIAS